jgi:transcriptional regulator with PAS, ATPase and Fis domain
MQPKLLRVLEDKEFERVGGNKLIRSDFRLIAATNQNLEEMVDDGRFRKDLFYRLSVIPIHITPLRKRRSDIVPIAQHLLQNLVQEATLSETRLDKSAVDVFRKFDWPGNVRELSNVLERALSSLEGDIIEIKNLPFYLTRGRHQTIKTNQSSIREAQATAEKEAILYALEETNYNKAKASGLLGIHRTLLYKKMKKYSIALQPN